jgi:pimeloyl-ACP methyl ester carboxylesterase
MPANTLIGYLAAFFAAAAIPSRAADAPQPPPPATAAARIQAPPTLHVHIGLDSVACGITPPAGGAPKTGKAGLIVWLHGGMRSQNREKGLDAHRGWLDYIPPRRYFVCSPSAYAGAEWPTPQGLAHIEVLIDYMLKHYPIDAGDVNMVGVSDGCLGVVAYSLQGSRPLHHRVLISSAPQLVLPIESLPGQPRFSQGSWDFVQGGKDRLFPAEQVFPYLSQFRALYPNAQVHAFPEGEHDFSWYAQNAPDLLRTFFADSRSSGKSRPTAKNEAVPKPASDPKADQKSAQTPN